MSFQVKSKQCVADHGEVFLISNVVIYGGNQI